MIVLPAVLPKLVVIVVEVLFVLAVWSDFHVSNTVPEVAILVRPLDCLY